MTEIIIPHKEIQNNQAITEVMEAKFKDKGLDIHTHEVIHLEDDFKRGVRQIKIKNKKVFLMPAPPWKK